MTPLCRPVDLMPLDLCALAPVSSRFRHWQLYLWNIPINHFPKLLHCPPASHPFVPRSRGSSFMFVITVGHLHFRPIFHHIYLSSSKGEALWCPSNLITAGAQHRQMLISSGSAVAGRKRGRRNPCGAKSKWIWPVVRGTLWNAQRQVSHSIMEAQLV